MLGPQRWLFALATTTLVLAGCASSPQTTATSTEPSASRSSEAPASTPLPDESDPTSEPSAPSYVDVVPGSLTNKKICNDYRDLLTSFEAEAKRRVNGAKGKAKDSWDAARFRKYNQWVKTDQQARLTDSLTQSATQALNEVSDGQAGAVRDLDAYLDDSIDTCGLTQLRSKAQAQVADANRLAEAIVSKADNKPWYPKGFEEWRDGVALKYMPGAGADCYGCRYWTYDVVAKDGCPNGLYIEISIVDSSDRAIDWTNDSLSSLQPGQRGRLVLTTYSDQANGFDLSELNCR